MGQQAQKNESTEHLLLNPLTSTSVPNGNAEKAAPINMCMDIFALDLDQLHIELTTAILCRSAPLRVQTPYKPDVLKCFIQVAGLTDCFNACISNT